MAMDQTWGFRARKSCGNFFQPIIGRTTAICAMVKSRYIGDGHPTFNRESL